MDNFIKEKYDKKSLILKSEILDLKKQIIEDEGILHTRLETVQSIESSNSYILKHTCVRLPKDSQVTEEYKKEFIKAIGKCYNIEKYLKDFSQIKSMTENKFMKALKIANSITDIILNLTNSVEDETNDVKKINKMNVYYLAATYAKIKDDEEVYDFLRNYCNKIYSSLDKKESKKMILKTIPKEFLEYVKK